MDDILKLSGRQVSVDDEPIYAALRGRPGRVGTEPIGFVFSTGYRSMVVGDQEYSFSDKQAQVIEDLYGAWVNGNPRRHQTELQGVANTKQRIGQLFAKHPAYGTLIKHDQGYYWLEL